MIIIIDNYFLKLLKENFHHCYSNLMKSRVEFIYQILFTK